MEVSVLSELWEACGGDAMSLVHPTRKPERPEYNPMSTAFDAAAAIVRTSAQAVDAVLTRAMAQYHYLDVLDMDKVFVDFRRNAREIEKVLEAASFAFAKRVAAKPEAES